MSARAGFLAFAIAPVHVHDGRPKEPMALSPQDEQMLDRAMALAAVGSIVDPNPRVGCVLGRD